MLSNSHYHKTSHMYLYSLHKFHTLLIVQIANSQNLTKDIPHIIPKKWRLILMSDGSCTRNLHTLTGHKTYIQMSQKYIYTIKTKVRNIRSVWLENHQYKTLTFARSICVLNNQYTNYIKLYTNKPIGTSFIKSEIEIYKKVQEIYYGHCSYLEKKFNSTKAIWGRKYITYYNQNSYIIIQEFFSPHLISFF